MNTTTKRDTDKLERRAAKLRREIECHNYHYFVFDSPIISDGRFDKLLRRQRAGDR
ncbi:MAG TPA: hypothetical protein VIJ43_03870 [Burkholderiales bacterium]